VTDLAGRILRGALLLGIVAAAAGVTSLVANRLPVAPPWARCLLVFAAAKIAGDVACFWLWRRHETLFLEDYGRQLGYFIALGALAAAAIIIARRFTGYFLDPALPAVGAYVVSVLVDVQGRR